MRGTRAAWLERKNALMSCIMSFIRSPNGVYSMVLKPCSDLVEKNNQGSSMRLNRTQLNAAVEENIISSSQADSLYEFLKAQSPDVPMFTFTHVLYYLGGLIAIGAMRSEEHTSELQSRGHLVCRLLLVKKKILSLMNQ